jgi:hypothetical protein
LFEALLGAGPTLAPRLLVAFGEQRHSSIAHKIFKSTQVLRQLQREAVHWRWQCPTFLQQTFVEWAAQTDNQSFWAGTFYRQQRDEGCPHQAAVRALAYICISIVFRCWKTNTPYNESVYLKALKRRGSPLMNQVADAIII